MVHAVVTGGASGIGAAVVERLRARGVDCTVLDLHAPVTPSTDEGVLELAADATDEAAVDAAIAAATEHFGPVTHAVLSHGIRGSFVPALEMDVASMRRLLDIHVVGTFVVAKAIVTRLTDGGTKPTQGASIVTVSSTTAIGGWAQQADYGTAKAGVAQLSQNLAIEWAPLGVRVNSVAPGMTLTPMVRDLIAGGYDVGATCARIPMGRLCEPDEMAAAMENLLLDATYTTGVCLPVDGGWTAVGK